MADMNEVYEALRTAQASGDKEQVAKLAQYIESQSQSQAQSQSQSQSQPQTAPATAPAFDAKADVRDFMSGGWKKEVPKNAMTEIAGSAGTGAVAGAFAPELVTMAGAASAAIPGIGPFIAPVLMSAGTAMRASRSALAVSGAISSAVGKTAAKGVEAMGGTETAQTAADVGFGLLSPAAGSAAAIARYVPGKVGQSWRAVQALTGGAGTAAGSGADSTLKATRAALAGGELSTLPAHDMYAMLQQGAQAGVTAAERAGADLIAKANAKAANLAKTDRAAAERVMAEAKAQAQSLKADADSRLAAISKATQGKAAVAERVRKQADTELSSIGAYQEPSDIGKNIMTHITESQKLAAASQRSADNALRTQRNEAVAAKEASGKFLSAEPGMKALKQELNTLLLSSKSGREASGGLARVTETGTEGAYRKVLDAINNKRVQTGVNEAGNPTYQTFQTSFEALDHVRRKLGKVGFSKEAEGFDALGQGIAKDLYRKIAKIQEDFAGPTQSALQHTYKEGLESGKKFTSPAARLAQQEFTDPAKVPGVFFSSQQGVQDLKALTENPGMVGALARSHAVRELAGRDSKQTLAYLAKNSDWIREVPGLSKDLNAYATKLSKIERIETKAGNQIAALQAEKTSLRAEVPKKIEGILGEARKEQTVRLGSRVEEQRALVDTATAEAKTMREVAVAKAQKIIGDDYPAASVRKLLLQGKPEELGAAVKILGQTPEGQKALAGSVRNVLASEGVSTNALKQVWTERLSVALGDGGVLPPAVFAKLDADVRKVLANEGATTKEKMRLVHKLVGASLAQAGNVGKLALGE